jgi:hypothetical protein
LKKNITKKPPKIGKHTALARFQLVSSWGGIEAERKRMKRYSTT